MVKIQKISEIEPRLGFTEFDMLKKYKKTRSHTDGFRKNNVKCLKPKGICSFVPNSSAYGF